MSIEASESIATMQPTAPDETMENPPSENVTSSPISPDFERDPKSIADLVASPDFPQCTLGEFVNIGGYTGVVIEIVKQSLKVKSPEGATRSFNYHALRKLYGVVIHEPPPVMSSSVERPAYKEKEARVKEKEEEEVPPPPKREFIAEPNFDLPLKPIAEFAARPDFPKCAYGEHIDFGGYKGVVVEIVNRSLKVKAVEGMTRSYNADICRKLHGQA